MPDPSVARSLFRCPSVYELVAIAAGSCLKASYNPAAAAAAAAAAYSILTGKLGVFLCHPCNAETAMLDQYSNSVMTLQTLAILSPLLGHSGKTCAEQYNHGSSAGKAAAEGAAGRESPSAEISSSSSHRRSMDDSHSGSPTHLPPSASGNTQLVLLSKRWPVVSLGVTYYLYVKH